MLIYSVLKKPKKILFSVFLPRIYKMLLFSVLYVDSLVLDEFVPLVVSGNP